VNELRKSGEDAILNTREATNRIILLLSDKQFEIAKARKFYSDVKVQLLKRIRSKRSDGGSNEYHLVATKTFDAIDSAFSSLSKISFEYEVALQAAKAARRPLDEKKLLDMLVDEMEDKYIELLEGTRAHCANVDNYLKNLATALDDDFNSQFYRPAFRRIRTIASGWDVALGQVESTSVLTNNRILGKVSPTATMEFDLPKRNIFVKEAFKGAKAAMVEYGALLNDPTFLALTRLYGVNSATAIYSKGARGGGYLPSAACCRVCRLQPTR
jgi:hypothetical protein